MKKIIAALAAALMISVFTTGCFGMGQKAAVATGDEALSQVTKQQIRTAARNAQFNITINFIYDYSFSVFAGGTFASLQI